MAFDLETVRDTTKITQANWAVRPREAFAGFWGPAVKAEVTRALGQKRLVILHNAQFDEGMLWANGIKIEGAIYDTMVATAILEPDLPNDLEHVAKDYTDLRPWKHLAGKDLGTYGCIDADATWRVYEGTKAELQENGVWGVFQTSMEVLPLLIEMKRAGLKIDQQEVGRLVEQFKADEAGANEALTAMVRGLPNRQEEHERLQAKVEELREASKVLRLAGQKGEAWRTELEARRVEKEAGKRWSVNWNSQKDLLGVLDDLGLERKIDHKTGRITTDGAAIQELARKSGNPVLLSLLAYRRGQKLRSTFLEHDYGDDGRLHPEYMLHRDYDLEGGLEGACSGRLASKRPNIQNWPAVVRSIIVPDQPDWEWTEADYSQIEFRIIAWRSGGPVWKLLNEQGFDIHRFVASHVYGGRPEDITEHQRWLAKRAVYAGAYLVGALTLSRRFMKDGIQLSVAECKKLLATFHRLFPEIKRASQLSYEEAVSSCKVTNPFGRYRRFYAPSAESTAIANYYPQASAGDIILRAMSRLRGELPGTGRIAVQVHDSLLVGHPRNDRKQVHECLREIMGADLQEMPGFKVPVDLKVGDSWGRLEKVAA